MSPFAEFVQSEQVVNGFRDTRYNRQELIPRFGPAAQEQLRRSTVAVIGAGGVKSPLLYYLAAAGVGRLRIFDPDVVELSNLNRQILYSTADIGRNKAEAAADRLRALNTEVEVEGVALRVDSETMDARLDGAQVVVEGGESAAERSAVNRFCVRRGVPMVHASAQYEYGYVLTVLPGVSACFDCVFPDLPSGGGSTPIMGTATGIAGSLGAAEVIKLLTGRGTPVTDGLLVFSLPDSTFDRVAIPRQADCPSCASEKLEHLSDVAHIAPDR